MMKKAIQLWRKSAIEKGNIIMKAGVTSKAKLFNQNQQCENISENGEKLK